MIYLLTNLLRRYAQFINSYTFIVLQWNKVFKSFLWTMLFCFRCYTVGEFPEMTGDPIFSGPVEDILTSPFCPNGYTDFHFECQVQYPQQATDNGARFRVSLTFDGQTDPNNPATHVITDGTELTVSFPSLALKGNVGKSVIITLIVHTHNILINVVVLKEIRIEI